MHDTPGYFTIVRPPHIHPGRLGEVFHLQYRSPVSPKYPRPQRDPVHVPEHVSQFQVPETVVPLSPNVPVISGT